MIESEASFRFPGIDLTSRFQNEPNETVRTSSLRRLGAVMSSKVFIPMSKEENVASFLFTAKIY